MVLDQESHYNPDRGIILCFVNLETGNFFLMHSIIEVYLCHLESYYFPVI